MARVLILLAGIGAVLRVLWPIIGPSVIDYVESLRTNKTKRQRGYERHRKERDGDRDSTSTPTDEG